MKISVNNNLVRLPENSSMADLLNQQKPAVPFAVALNSQFVSKQNYQQVILQENDRVDIVNPVAGG